MTRPRLENCVDYIEFPATNLAATKTFYRKVFGWKFADYGPGYSSFADGRLTGGFTTEARPKRGGALVVIYSSRLDAQAKKVAASGGKIVKPLFTFPGGRRFHFADPSGNVLAVWSDR
ncbi:MAG: VOC family protein [Planctomycetes bacterium]|nr:VOC family protein [Planctomycetota bacterium]